MVQTFLQYLMFVNEVLNQQNIVTVSHLKFQ